jgi:hypothetical protein
VETSPDLGPGFCRDVSALDLGDPKEHLVALRGSDRVLAFTVEAVEERPGDQEVIRFREGEREPGPAAKVRAT